jgi:hypothetical protein
MSVQSLGMKMINPIQAEIIAETNTAPAAISLAFPANLFCCGEAKSTTFSMAVFTISAVKTRPKQSKQSNHSVMLMRKIHPKIITNTVKVKWMRMFLSVLNTVATPRKAFLKLCIKRFISYFHTSDIGTVPCVNFYGFPCFDK